MSIKRGAMLTAGKTSWSVSVDVLLFIGTQWVRLGYIYAIYTLCLKVHQAVSGKTHIA